jgi:hypothetical protein
MGALLELISAVSVPIGVALTALGIAVVVDVLVSRMGAARPAAYGASLLSGVVVAVVDLCVAALHGREETAGAVVALLLYASWWFVYLNFAQAFDSSLRIRLLLLIRENGGRLSRAELARQFSDERMIQVRLERLLQGGYLLERDGRLFVVSARLRLLARFFRFLKFAMLGRRSEFEQPRRPKPPST